MFYLAHSYCSDILTTLSILYLKNLSLDYPLISSISVLTTLHLEHLSFDYPLSRTTFTDFYLYLKHLTFLPSDFFCLILCHYFYFFNSIQFFISLCSVNSW